MEQFGKELLYVYVRSTYVCSIAESVYVIGRENETGDKNSR